MTEQIDFVVLWVDGTDPDWQKERAYYIREGQRQYIQSVQKLGVDAVLVPWRRAICILGAPCLFCDKWSDPKMAECEASQTENCPS